MHNDKEKLEICRLALKQIGKALRDNPFPLENNSIPYRIYLSILCGGNKRDPEGFEFINYFLEEAEKEFNEKYKNEECF